MHAHGPATWYRGVHCFSGKIEQSSLDSTEGRPTEKDSCGGETRKTSVVRKSAVYVTVNVLSVPGFSGCKLQPHRLVAASQVRYDR